MLEKVAQRKAATPVKVQTKLAIDTPGDRYEQEAERVAGQIMRMPATHVSAGAPARSEPSPETEEPVRALHSGGEPLDLSLRSFFEPRFGHDFGQIRVHTDAEAAATARDLAALAYTQGRHIVFAPGQYQPHTERGQRLVAHELTHVVQQCAAGQERIHRAPDDPPAPAPALASPTITFTPGTTLVRGDTLTANVASTPGVNVTDWKYTTAAGDVVARPKRDAKFQSEWKGVMALSGNLELSYTVKPRGKAAVAGTPITSAVTVNDRTGAAWQTTITDAAETTLGGMPSPPEKAEQLGNHEVPAGYEPAAAETPIRKGPNDGFTFAGRVEDRNYKSEPQIHPDVLDAASAFRVFHRNAMRLFFENATTRVRTPIPPAEYTVRNAAAGTFTVPNWMAFYKKYGVFRVTCTDDRNSRNVVEAQNDWWVLDPNTETGNLKITNERAVRAALKIGASAGFTPAMTPNGAFQSMPLMHSNKIPPATRSHENAHPTHSHRANFHAIVRALDPRRVIESSVSTPSNPIVFKDKISGLLAEIKKPFHELVDEAASKAAGRFVPIPGKTMAAINQDPASGANLGALWDITHDQPLG